MLTLTLSNQGKTTVIEFDHTEDLTLVNKVRDYIFPGSLPDPAMDERYMEIMAARK